MKSLLTVLREARRALAAAGTSSPRTDAEWLAGYVLGLRRIDLYMQYDRPLEVGEEAAIAALVARAATGEPIQYIVGSTEFYNCELLVGPGVLVPRPETEVLVGEALRRHRGGAILDLCTGSGAIPLALAGELNPRPPLIGTDIAAAALDYARRNAARLALADAVEFRQGDLFAPVAGQRFALITANPPYVAPEEFADLPRNVRDFEPPEALLAEDHGLAVTRRIFAAAPAHLEAGGWLLVEIGESQAAAVAAMATGDAWAQVEVIADYAQKERIIAARRAG